MKKPSLLLPESIGRRMKREAIVRIIADILMINAVLALAFILRFLWGIGVEGVSGSARNALIEYIQAFYTTAWLLTLISLTAFHISGLYSHSRFYSEPYKALVIVQAVSISYLVFSFLMLLLRDVVYFPRSVLITGWLLTVMTLLGARLWLAAWISSMQKEQTFTPNLSSADGQIKRVLVIGGAGYIGSALLPKLLAKGYHVRLLDLLLYGSEPIRAVLEHPRLEIIQGDFLQMDHVVQAMRDVDAIIHLGAIVGDPACELSPELTIEVNLMATRMIAEVAHCMKVNRLIFASTCSVYGACDDVLDEHSDLNPVSLYASSKVASEKVLLSMMDTDFSPVILRFGTIYGLSGRTRFDLVINLLTAKAEVERQITVFGGDQWRPFVHVDDAALAVVTALESPVELVRGQIFNVGSNEQNLTIRQVAELINGIVSEAVLVEMEDRVDTRNYFVNFNKIQRVLGFAPQWTIERGVRQILDAIRSNRITDYRLSEYSNVTFLREQGIDRFDSHAGQWTTELVNEAISMPARGRGRENGQ